MNKSTLALRMYFTFVVVVKVIIPVVLIESVEAVDSGELICGGATQNQFLSHNYRTIDLSLYFLDSRHGTFLSGYLDVYDTVTKGAKMDIRKTFDCHINFTMMTFVTVSYEQSVKLN